MGSPENRGRAKEWAGRPSRRAGPRRPRSRPRCCGRGWHGGQHSAGVHAARVGGVVLPGGFSMLLWKIHPGRLNGWNLQPSPMKRKENDLNQTSMIMVHVDLPGCIPKIHFGIGNIFYFFQMAGLAGVWLPYSLKNWGWNWLSPPNFEIHHGKQT